jgi:ATP-dependent DNA helicase DinG
MQARREAQQADLLVINHHLFFVDLALKGEGFGEVLPDADAVIFDEAHQLPDIARQYFGEALSSRRITEVLNDVKREYDVLQESHADLTALASELFGVLQQVKQALGHPGQRAVLSADNRPKHLAERLDNLSSSLQRYADLLEPEIERSTGLERCYQRSLELILRLQSFQQAMAEEVDHDWIHWYEIHERRFVLHNTPVDVAEIMQGHLDLQHRAWIFTSATLSVGGKFEHFVNELGLTSAHCHEWKSPFPYQQNALLYLPKNLPAPNSPGFHEGLIDICLPIMRKLKGNTFVLVTSYDALRKVRAILQAHSDFTLLVQGDQSKAVLLERFREEDNVLLLGTSSFWEGVDVKGAALSCVIIDKLPFAAPSDPVLQARIKQIQENGGNGFMAIQIPQAVIRLKQGAGRLIRDENDKGLLIIADPRVTTQRYGQLFLRSLPAMRRVEDYAEVQHFIENELCI